VSFLERRKKMLEDRGTVTSEKGSNKSIQSVNSSGQDQISNTAVGESEICTPPF